LFCGVQPATHSDRQLTCTSNTGVSRNSSQSDAEKIRTIKELLSVKAGLVALSSFDASQVDFMIQTLCTQ